MSFDYGSHVYHAYGYFEGQGRCLVLMFFSFFGWDAFFLSPTKVPGISFIWAGYQQH
jgi:hypothetical protein